MALVLGLLSAIGPFAIDMYLPALPEIGRDLGSSTSVTQLSLLAFFISFALAQLVYGPLSDMWGRKVPLYIGITLFAFASIGCALAPDIESLIAFRFLQGIGGAAGMVIPRAVVRDMHTGVQAAPSFSSRHVALSSRRVSSTEPADRRALQPGVEAPLSSSRQTKLKYSRVAIESMLPPKPGRRPALYWTRE